MSLCDAWSRKDWEIISSSAIALPGTTMPKYNAAVLGVLAISLISLNREIQSIASRLSHLATDDDETSRKNENYAISHRGSTGPVHRVIPLLELVNTNNETYCAPPLVRVGDTIAPDFHIDFTSHRIPKIVHVTSRSRCMTQLFADNIDRWRFQGWSLFFHDDDAMDRLMNQYWPMFPQVSESVKCMLSGASKADLWRGLVLWEYGGVYTDIDNGPNKFDGDYLTDEDSLFVVEIIGVLSQYFMAASPRHPIMHQLLLSVMHRLYDLNEVSKQYAPSTTGPGALKLAFIHFMHAQTTWEGWTLENEVKGLYGKVTNGTYVGLGNRSVTVVGYKEKSQEYIVREIIRGKEKFGGYADMGMTHFNTAEKEGVERNESCFNRLYDQIDWSEDYDDSQISKEHLRPAD